MTLIQFKFILQIKGSQTLCFRSHRPVQRSVLWKYKTLHVLSVGGTSMTAAHRKIYLIAVITPIFYNPDYDLIRNQILFHQNYFCVVVFNILFVITHKISTGPQLLAVKSDKVTHLWGELPVQIARWKCSSPTCSWSWSFWFWHIELHWQLFYPVDNTGHDTESF